MGRAEQVFAPVFDPLDRLFEFLCQPRQDKLFREEVRLLPETAAYRRRNYSDNLLRDAEIQRNRRAQEIRHLGGRPYR